MAHSKGQTPFFISLSGKRFNSFFIMFAGLRSYGVTELRSYGITELWNYGVAELRSFGVAELKPFVFLIPLHGFLDTSFELPLGCVA